MSRKLGGSKLTKPYNRQWLTKNPVELLCRLFKCTLDTPPRLESKEVRESVQRADVICIPMRPSPMDFGVTTNTAELVKTLKRPDSKAFIILNQLRKGTYWSKKVETLNGSDFALSFAHSSFSLRECFAHALTVGWDALDESASNELLNFALTIG